MVIYKYLKNSKRLSYTQIQKILKNRGIQINEKSLIVLTQDVLF